MLGVWLMAVLLLLPAVAAGQNQSTVTPIQPVVPGPIIIPSPATGAQIIVNPRTPPSPTISSAPEVVIPIPTEDTTRPVKIFDIRPTLSLVEDYTDNFNQTTKDKVSNYRSGISPGLLILLQHPFLTGQLSYTPLAYYDSSSKDAAVNHALAAQAIWEITPRLKLTGTEAFTQSDQPAAADRLNLRQGREQFTSNTASITGDYLFEPFAAQAYYRLSHFSSDSDTTTTHTPGGSLTMTVAQINAFTLGYEYLDTKTTVDDTSGRSSTNFFGPTQDSKTTGHQVTGTYTREVSKDVTAGLTAVYATRDETTMGDRMNFTRKSVSLFSNYVVPEKLIILSNIGVAQLDSDRSSGSPLVTSNSDITYFSGPLTLGLRVERGFSETFGTGQNFGVVETASVSGSVGYKFTPYLSAFISGAYRENKFRGDGGGGNTQSGQDDKIVSATANITYQILRWLTATVDYTYTDKRSSDPLASYVENRVRGALNASFY